MEFFILCIYHFARGSIFRDYGSKNVINKMHVLSTNTINRLFSTLCLYDPIQLDLIISNTISKKTYSCTVLS